MFASKEWATSNHSSKNVGKKVINIVLWVLDFENPSNNAISV